MSLHRWLDSQPMENCKALHNDLVSAGIALSAGGDYRAIFRTGRANSKGKLKKIYAALYKAEKSKMITVVEELTRMISSELEKREIIDEKIAAAS
jgi:hypothetical protein